ncbi:MAG: lipocalin family protein [Burkholderiaceae bacterium]|nr:lipocalin family protein [Burkholderiaceae bacterium]
MNYLNYLNKFAHTTRRSSNAGLAALTVSALATLSACNTTDRVPDANLPALSVVSSVDVPRYLGTWYQQALIPNSFQAQCVSDTRATYVRNGDDLVVVNQCRRADGKVETAKGIAKIVDGSNNAKLRVSFFRPFYGDYWVLALDPGYNWVLVGEPKRKFGWVLSRDTKLDETTLNQILDRAVALGYDRAEFRRSIQGTGG